MTTEHPLDLEVVFNSQSVPNVSILDDPDRLFRTGHVEFDYHDDGYEVRAYGAIFPETPAGEPPYVGHLDRDESWMLSMIEECLQSWESYIDDHYNRPGKRFAFDGAHLDAIAPGLAEAGDELYSAVFLQGDGGLRTIGRLLSEAMRSGEQTVTFHSDRLFVPWWLIYDQEVAGSTQGRDRGWSPHGFWGYRNLIEHEFVRCVPPADHRIRLARTPLQVSLNLDLTLDDQHERQVTQPVQDFFNQQPNGCEHIIRSTKSELRAALMSTSFRDQLLYFCCHCGTQPSRHGGPNRTVLALSDSEYITAVNVCGWLRERNLPSRPFVFLNACGGGVLSTQFYCSFGHELIRKDANCFVGPQVQIPAVFAGTYAVELFTRFLKPHSHLGPIMREVTRHFMDAQFNPLGLVYGLYRGLDTRLVVDP